MAGNASQLTVNIVLDTPWKQVLNCTILGDSTGDLVNTPVYTKSSATNKYPAQEVHLVEGALNGFSAVLYFDQTTPKPIQNLPNGQYFVFNSIAGKADTRSPMQNPNGTGTTGNITISTTGMNATQQGSFQITLAKNPTITTST